MEFLPILAEFYVTNFSKSLDFYVSIIGFKIEYQRDNPNFAFLSYNGSQIMIQELVPGEKESEKLEYPFGRGINFQIETQSVQTIIGSLMKNNYPLKRGIKDSWYQAGNKSYGCREILVLDPDGYLLRFSEELGGKTILAKQSSV
jgi:catechol 2,3-dioxygenase-like lactoylglutathione lyase family enzyme